MLIVLRRGRVPFRDLSPKYQIKVREKTRRGQKEKKKKERENGYESSSGYQRGSLSKAGVVTAFLSAKGLSSSSSSLTSSSESDTGPRAVFDAPAAGAGDPGGKGFDVSDGRGGGVGLVGLELLMFRPEISGVDWELALWCFSVITRWGPSAKRIIER